jgi:hypothetical protein
MNDPEIRQLLYPQLVQYEDLLDELPIGHTSGAMTRADVVGLGQAQLHGYEIKGDNDTLRRVPLQLNCYGHVFSAVSFVVVEKHLPGLATRLPPWVGIWQVRAGQLECVRPAGTNPGQNKTWLAGLLWQAELVTFLKAHEVPVLSRWRVWECWEALEATEAIAVQQLEAYVCECLRQRLGEREQRRATSRERRQQGIG